MPPPSVNQSERTDLFSERHNFMTASLIPRTAPLRCLRATAVLIGLLVVVAGAPPAHASEGEAQVWGALALANANAISETGQWGPGAQLGVLAGITDFWSIAGGVEGSYHFLEQGDDIPASEVVNLFGGFRYNLDIFKYVPYVGLSIVNHILGPPDEPGDTGPVVGAKFTVGLDWRYARHWSAGAMFELHAPLDAPGDFPNYSTLGFNLAYHFRL